MPLVPHMEPGAGKEVAASEGNQGGESLRLHKALVVQAPALPLVLVVQRVSSVLQCLEGLFHPEAIVGAVLWI